MGWQKQGQRFVFRPEMEELPRRIVPATWDVTGATLTVLGLDNVNDYIYLSTGNGKIYFNDIDPDQDVEVADVSAISTIIVNGKSGNDNINIWAMTEGTYAVTLKGEDGNDTISGAAMADVIYGGAGNDEIWGFGNGDILFGGVNNALMPSGDDTILGNTGDDNIYGEDGSDSLFGNWGTDYVHGGADSDYIEGDDLPDSVY